MVLGKQTNLFLGKNMFSVEKTNFSYEKLGFVPKSKFFLGKGQNKNVFGVWPYSCPKDVYFLFFCFS